MTVGDAAGAPALTAVTEFSVNKNGQTTSRTEYDWVTYAGSGVETGVTPRRFTSWSYFATVPDASVVSDPEWNVYWNPPNQTPVRLNAVRRRLVSDGATPVAATEFDYDNPWSTGNVTAEKRWDSEKSPSLPLEGLLDATNSQVLTRAYDAKGNLIDIFAPEVRTHFTWDVDGNVPIQVDHAYQTAEERSFQYVWNTAAAGAGLPARPVDITPLVRLANAADTSLTALILTIRRWRSRNR